MKQFKKIVLTGASGRLGSYLREPLSNKTEKLVSLDINALGKTLKNEQFELADLSNYPEIERVLEGANVVVHFAALSNEGPFEKILEANIVGAFNIWKAAQEHKIKRIIFASSIHAVGMHESTSMANSNVMHRPDTFYGLSKCFGEDLGRMYWDKCAIECLCIRIISCAKVTSNRALGTWLSYDDLVRIVVQSIEIEELGFEIIYGVSNNKRSPVNNENAKKLGLEIEDNAEVFAENLLQQGMLDEKSPGDNYLGGPFAIAPLGSDAMATMNIVDDRKLID